MSETIWVAIIGAIALIIAAVIPIYLSQKKNLKKKPKLNYQDNFVPKVLPTKKTREPLAALPERHSTDNESPFMSDDYLVNFTAELKETLRPRDKIDADFEDKN